MASGGREHQEGAGELGEAGEDFGTGGGGPESDTQFLYCHDTTGPPLWGGVLGTHKEDGVYPGLLPGQGSMAIDRKNVTPWEGRTVDLPPPGGGYQGCGGSESQDIGPPETEYGSAIHCNATDSGALRGDGAAAGDTGPTLMVGATRYRLEAGEGKGGKGGGNSGTCGSTCGGDGDTRIGNGSGGGCVTGVQWIQRGRMERGGGLRLLT